MTILDRIADNLENCSQDAFITYLKDGRNPSTVLSCQEFIDTSKKIAAFWSERYPTCKRIGLVYTATGAFLAPLIYAGFLASKTIVPIKIPKPSRNNDRARYIFDVVEMDLIVTRRDHQRRLQATLENLGVRLVEILAHEDLMKLPRSWVERYTRRPADDDFVGIIQFTSGSTSYPNAVPLTLVMMQYSVVSLSKAMKIDSQSSLYNWMPFFHDFGLIFGVIFQMFIGCRMAMTSPITFLQSPLSCLLGMMENNITHSAMASFGIEHCLIAAKKNQKRLRDWTLHAYREFFLVLTSFPMKLPSSS